MDIDMSALRLLENEREIKADYLIDAIEEALTHAYAKVPGHADRAKAKVDRKTGRVTVWVEQVNDEGEVVGEYDGTPDNFGRIAAATARQIIMQRIQAAEDEQKYGRMIAVEGDIVLGTITQDANSSDVRVDLGPVEAIMMRDELVPGEDYSHGRKMRVYVTRVRRERHGLRIEVSRKHPRLVEKLFALESPEIAQGVVQIKATAREAGRRTKIAVWSKDPNISAKGACIGPMGQRVRAVTHELNGEMIDIIDWSEDPKIFVAEALSPAHVIAVQAMNATTKAARVIVPDYQYSLAIGRGGQNVALAARLTGWKIDIHSDTEGLEPDESD